MKLRSVTNSDLSVGDNSVTPFVPGAEEQGQSLVAETYAACCEGLSRIGVTVVERRIDPLTPEQALDVVFFESYTTTMPLFVTSRFRQAGARMLVNSVGIHF